MTLEFSIAIKYLSRGFVGPGPGYRHCLGTTTYPCSNCDLISLMRSFFALNFQTFKRIQELDENVAQIHKKTLEIEMVANSVNSLARVSLPDQIGVLRRTQSDQFGLFEVLINSNSDEIIKAKKELKSVQNKTALDFKNDLENAINEIESNIALRESDRSHEFNKILNTTVSEVKLSQRQTKTDLTQFRVIKLFYKKFYYH